MNLVEAAASLAAFWLALTPPPPRQVAVTFDDLPGASVIGDGVPALEAMTSRLLAAIRETRVPAIGFVNEGKLAPEGRREAARVGLLARWIESGLELGNHTYSHRDLHRSTLDEFEADVRRGEDVTRALLKERGHSLRYFRHPFLHTGLDLPTKVGLEAFLKARGCRVAPVTHDNAEWIFARAYASAGQRGDRALQARIAEAYVPYMDAKFDYFERQSRALFQREIPQVLLLHSNSLNADTFGAVAAMMKKRGYSFVTLDKALQDEAYRSPDTYTGRAGITWLHRWALTRGGEGLILPDEPRSPDWILREAGVDGE